MFTWIGNFRADFGMRYSPIMIAYSFVNLDLRRSDAIITMPEADEIRSNKNGIRYQSVMIVAHGIFFQFQSLKISMIIEPNIL